MWIQWLLQQKDSQAPAWLHQAEVSCPRNNQSCWALMPILTQISLWIKSHWVLLGYGKKYLCDHCDYLFEGLNDNLLKALELVQIQTIQWWGNWFFHWVEAYCLGLGSVEAHAHVKKYTFRQFTSHRYVSKRVAATFGWCMSTVVPSVQGWPNWFMLKSLLPQSQSN